MKTVISASRRTDIPAFYLTWFMNAIKKGYVDVQNPLYKSQFKKVNLSPETVDWIVFWSRNYDNFLKNADFFSGYQLYFHFTIISHHPALEKKAIRLEKAIAQTEKLAARYGPDRIIWRYDPIVVWRDTNGLQSNFNDKEFEWLSEHMHQIGIRSCYFSFATPYKKFRLRFKQKFPGYEIISDANLQKSVLKRMKAIARTNSITLFSCCNDQLIDDQIHRGSCISGHVLNMLNGKKSVSEARNPVRNDCGCTKSVDIANYDMQPCFFGCIYCYANPLWK